MSEIGQTTSPGLRIDLKDELSGLVFDQAPWKRRGRSRLRRRSLAWANRYQRLILVSDALVLTSVVLLAQFLRFGLQDAAVWVWKFEVGYAVISVVFAAAWMLALGAYHSRDARVLGVGSDEYKRVISASVTVLGSLAIFSLIGKVDVARGFFALAFPLGMVGLFLSRWGLRCWLTLQRRNGHFLSRVIVLGNKGDVRYVANQINKKSGAAYEVVGAGVPDGDERTDIRVDGRRIPVVCTPRSVIAAVTSLDADAVIVAGPMKGGSRYIRKLGWRLEETGTELVLATGLTNVAGPRIHSRPVEGLPLMHVELPQYAGAKHAMKRVTDIVLAGGALLVLSPVFLVLATLIRRDSPGPIIFRQQRIGRGGAPFLMFKFRSMVQDAEDNVAGLLDQNEGAGVLFKVKNDPRITEVGRWMRRYSLDELPQLWNVLLGDMSLVGPRPPLAHEVAGYKSHVHRRLYIKPGLTGMWQTNGRSNLTWQESVRLDLYYVENWSLAGDIMIMWRTVKMLKDPVGAY